jgi:hypothetical protein
LTVEKMLVIGGQKNWEMRCQFWLLKKAFCSVQIAAFSKQVFNAEMTQRGGV